MELVEPAMYTWQYSSKILKGKKKNILDSYAELWVVPGEMEENRDSHTVQQRSTESVSRRM